MAAELGRQRKTKAMRQGGEIEKDTIPIYKRMDARHARESRRPKSSYGNMDALIFGMFIKIRIS